MSPTADGLAIASGVAPTIVISREDWEAFTMHGALSHTGTDSVRSPPPLILLPPCCHVHASCWARVAVAGVDRVGEADSRTHACLIAKALTSQVAISYDLSTKCSADNFRLGMHFQLAHYAQRLLSSKMAESVRCLVFVPPTFLLLARLCRLGANGEAVRACALPCSWGYARERCCESAPPSFLTSAH